MHRAMEDTFLRLSREFPVLLLTGPRQVGKTTMLQKLAAEENIGREYVTLDDLTERQMAKNDPKMFLEIHKTPVFIDEVQYAPELFTYIKIHVESGLRTGVIDKASLERGTGAVLCTTDKLSAFDSQNLIVPIWGI